MSKTINARSLLEMDPEEILSFPKRFPLQFDDGVIIDAQRKMTALSLHMWKIFLDFPHAPLLPEHHIQVLLDGRNLQSSTANKLVKRIFDTIVNKDQFIHPEDREVLQRRVQNAVNDMYLMLRRHSGAHLQTIDIVDCIQVTLHPEVIGAWVNAEQSPKEVERVNGIVKKVIETDPSLRDNGMASAMRSGAVKANQVFQSVGLRGYPKEVDGRIFRTPIRSNYVYGITNMFEFAADSRGSAEHLKATESPLQDSEYFSRRLQLQTCVVERISYTDCGTTRTIPHLVKPPSIDDASGDYYGGDLKHLIGKKYINPEDGKLLTIFGNEKHLIGKTIQMRSPITCEHDDPHAVCQVCLGLLANNHSRWANLGVVAATTIVSKISQKTLGTKHHIASGQGSGIVLSAELRRYFRRGKKNTDYLLERDTSTWGLKLVVARDHALGLIGAEDNRELVTTNPERLTSISHVRFIGTQPASGIAFSDYLTVMQGNRYASMSVALLNYIQKHGWEMDNRNNFVIDLKDWNPDDVLMTLPDIQVSFSAHGNAIAEVIESKFSQLAERNSDDAPIRVLNQVFEMVAPKLDSINIADVEVIVYALQIPRFGSYSMSRGKANPVMGIGKDLILNRSMGTACAYQEWKHNFLDPRSYSAVNKPDTMMDVFLKPKEVVAAFNAKPRHPDRIRQRRVH